MLSGMPPLKETGIHEEWYVVDTTEGLWRLLLATEADSVMSISQVVPHRQSE